MRERLGIRRLQGPGAEIRRLTHQPGRLATRSRPMIGLVPRDLPDSRVFIYEPNEDTDVVLQGKVARAIWGLPGIVGIELPTRDRFPLQHEEEGERPPNHIVIFLETGDPVIVNIKSQKDAVTAYRARRRKYLVLTEEELVLLMRQEGTIIVNGKRPATGIRAHCLAELTAIQEIRARSS